LLNGSFSSGIDSTDMSLSRTYTELDVDSFGIYDVKEEYLKYGVSNSFISSVELGIASKQYFYTNGEIQTIEIPESLTRTFEINGSTCDFNRADLVIYDRFGNALDENTRPFWYDGQTISFQSTDPNDHGVYDWSSLGIKMYINDDPWRVFDEPEEEIVAGEDVVEVVPTPEEIYALEREEELKIGF